MASKVNNAKTSKPAAENKAAAPVTAAADNKTAGRPEPPKEQIYIGNLSFQTSEEDLKNEFKRFGQIKEVSIPTNPYSGRKKGFAFVTFVAESSVKPAVDGTDGKEVGGRALRVAKADGSARATREPAASADGDESAARGGRGRRGRGRGRGRGGRGRGRGGAGRSSRGASASGAEAEADGEAPARGARKPREGGARRNNRGRRRERGRRITAAGLLPVCFDQENKQQTTYVMLGLENAKSRFPDTLGFIYEPSSIQAPAPAQEEDAAPAPQPEVEKWESRVASVTPRRALGVFGKDRSKFVQNAAQATEKNQTALYEAVKTQVAGIVSNPDNYVRLNDRRIAAVVVGRKTAKERKDDEDLYVELAKLVKEEETPAPAEDGKRRPRPRGGLTFSRVVWVPVKKLLDAVSPLFGQTRDACKAATVEVEANGQKYKLSSQAIPILANYTEGKWPARLSEILVNGKNTPDEKKEENKGEAKGVETPKKEEPKSPPAAAKKEEPKKEEPKAAAHPAKKEEPKKEDNKKTAAPKKK